ncbi:MAG: hypothetical protein AB7R77_22135 [Ilumatobacteraceae bacterium]
MNLVDEPAASRRLVALERPEEALDAEHAWSLDARRAHQGQVVERDRGTRYPPYRVVEPRDGGLRVGRPLDIAQKKASMRDVEPVHHVAGLVADRLLADGQRLIRPADVQAELGEVGR